jgi:hypothetical protein
MLKDNSYLLEDTEGVILPVVLIQLVCTNGGNTYVCNVGSYKAGLTCTGAETSDTQTCQGMHLLQSSPSCVSSSLSLF